MPGRFDPYLLGARHLLPADRAVSDIFVRAAVQAVRPGDGAAAVLTAVDPVLLGAACGMIRRSDVNRRPAQFLAADRTGRYFLIASALCTVKEHLVFGNGISGSMPESWKGHIVAGDLFPAAGAVDDAVVVAWFGTGCFSLVFFDRIGSGVAESSGTAGGPSPPFRAGTAYRRRGLRL